MCHCRNNKKGKTADLTELTWMELSKRLTRRPKVYNLIEKRATREGKMEEMMRSPEGMKVAFDSQITLKRGIEMERGTEYAQNHQNEGVHIS